MQCPALILFTLRSSFTFRAAISYIARVESFNCPFVCLNCLSLLLSLWLVVDVHFSFHPIVALPHYKCDAKLYLRFPEKSEIRIANWKSQGARTFDD